MKSLKYYLISFITLSITVGMAQTKNQKTERVKIYGNCDMCESTIEKAGKMKNQAHVDWDKETKMAILLYDSLKTSKEEILKRIALAGYDSDAFLAPDDTYSNLMDCCQYERANKTTLQRDDFNRDIAANDHSIHLTNMNEVQNSNPLAAVFDSYFAVKDALVKSDGALTAINAKKLLTAIHEVKMTELSTNVHLIWMNNLNSLKNETKAMADSKDVESQRSFLDALSKKLYELMKVSNQETPTYYQFCPMANGGKGANWLSKDETIKNPYYGTQMLSCGKTVEILKE